MPEATQNDGLIAALDAALTRPNPPVSILGNPDPMCRAMINQGATHRKNRYGFGGVFVGYTYLAEDGRVVCESMTGCGNPR